MKNFIILLILLPTAFLYTKLPTYNNQVIQFDMPNNEGIDVSEDYLSFALDMAQVLGGKWWEGSMDFTGGRGGKITKPFDFNRNKLDELLRPLAPFTLRLGGSEADSAHYDIKSTRTVLTQSEKEQGFQTLFNKTKLDNIKSFVSRNNLDLLITLNIGPGYRNDGELNLTPIENFIQNLSQEIKDIKYFELGNEANAFFLNYGPFGQISESEYKRNYREIKNIIRKYYPEAKLAGPANAFWPILGEVFDWFTVNSFNIVKDLGSELDIYTWHYYPTQSTRCPLQVIKSDNESMIKAIKSNDMIETMEAIAKVTKGRSKEVWLGETGPAQCGGQPGVSTEFNSALWFFDHIFKVMAAGNKKLIRQTIVGSDYGLINDKELRPNHDYYIARIYKKLNITKIYSRPNDSVHTVCANNKISFLTSVIDGQTITLPRTTDKYMTVNEKALSAFDHLSFESQFEKKWEETRRDKIDIKNSTILIIKTTTGCNEL
ncbi:hypothetical protein ABMA77_09030 [Halobacteriovorax sp. RZ-1]|uniref:hypothetical protein n=1 Tax=unclassified Halobacteriovorax TaxID=2639665 RepID=UPI003711E6AC